jgi:hypothetical protein
MAFLLEPEAARRVSDARQLPQSIVQLAQKWSLEHSFQAMPAGADSKSENG